MSKIKERPPHQQRVLHERAELHYRLNKLDTFIQSDNFTALSGQERGALLDQRTHMSRYRDSLDRRIALFENPQA